MVDASALISGVAGTVVLEVVEGGRVRVTGPDDTLLEFDAAELQDAWAKLMHEDAPAAG